MQREEAVLALQLAGLAAFGAPDGQTLDQLMRLHTVDVVVLDVGLPGESGLVIAERLAALAQPVGVIMLTALGLLDDKLQGMLSGADTYLVKPADPRELIANIAALRRRMASANTALASQAPAPHPTNWAISAGGHQLMCGRAGLPSVNLSELQRRFLLAFRGAHVGQTVSRERIMDALGHDGGDVDPHRLETLISRLRQKVRNQLGEDLPLHAVPGLGYTLTQAIASVPR